ncbi:hypothetical protein [Shewanella donghaensis]|uniref:hypothetical protein n=1 Tax=Shewanella donghaensis TaxID=238836 RepID=UPI001182DC52|nr:hypothetical protein [Shewanella donghaensis]
MDNLQREIIEYYAKGVFSFDGDYFTSVGLPKEKFDILFPLAIYPSSQFIADNGTVDIEEINFIFKDYHKLLEHIECLDLDIIDNSYNKVILDSDGIIELGEFAQHYKKWIQIFDEIADHQYPINDLSSGRTYIFIEKNDNQNSTVLNINIDDVSEKEICKLIKSISNPKLLLESCLQKDAHQGEKKATLKSSLLKVIRNKNIPLIEILSLGETLLNTFHKNYETYLRSFSFEDFIKDLEDDVGDFISKVEEQIQGFYVQALAVPGAVILASAFRGADKGISIALLFSTVLALTIVFSSLKSKTKFITRVTENTLTKLSIYKKRTTDIKNTFAQQTILEKINAAIKSVEDTAEDCKSEIKKLKNFIIILVSTYVIVAVLFEKM